MNRPDWNKISHLTPSSILSAIAPALVGSLLLLTVGHAVAAQYLNSTEPMCNGTDPTVLLCDDFEDGKWYVTNADTSGGKNNPENDGWAGNIFASTPANAVCGSAGAAGTNCTATTGVRFNDAKYQAWHWFGPNENQYEEIYHRFYVKFSLGYDFGHEKLVAYHRDASINTQIGFLHSPWGHNKLSIFVNVSSLWLDQNQGNDLSWTPGHWYYVEVHWRLDTTQGAANGLVEVWADDCGANGLGCTGPGTLRLRHTGQNIRVANGLGFGTINQENWLPTSPPSFTGGGEVHNDQVVVRTRRIGPMGVMQPPSNLQVQ
jgi:hypothetical protein